jgi:uncharacterized protein (TIGR02246 family)
LRKAASAAFIVSESPSMIALRQLGVFLFLAIVTVMPAAAEPMDVAKEMASAMSAAVDEGDLDAVAGLYAEDALVLYPSGKTASGRDAIRKANEENQKAGTNVLKFGTGRAVGDDSQVSVVWTWELTVTPEGKASVITKGRSLLFLRHVEDKWQIVFDMFQAANGK